MARIRTIKPEFWKHEGLCALPEATHMLAAALLNYADDFGYFNANPKLIQGEIYPLREPSVPLPESLRSLQTTGYLRLGTGADGRRYGHIVEFEAHQKVSHPTTSKIARISITWDNSGKSPENIVRPQETFVPEGKGKEGKGKEDMPAKAGLCADPEFEEFWENYKPPRNSKKPDAKKAWLAMAKTRPAQADHLQAVSAYNSWLASEWQKNRREFPAKQHPSTWLRGEVWNGFRSSAPDIDPERLAELRDKTDRTLKRGKYAEVYQ